MSDPQTIFIPAKPRIGRKRRQVAASAPPVAGPVLVWATFDADSETLTLSFDRAIDMSAYVPFDIVVRDASTLQEFGGTEAHDVLDPQTVKITLIVNGEYEGEGTKLTATDGAGIVASEDSSPWVGVSDLSLPFP